MAEIGAAKASVTEAEAALEEAILVSRTTRTDLSLVSHRFRDLLHTGPLGKMPMWLWPVRWVMRPNTDPLLGSIKEVEERRDTYIKVKTDPTDRRKDLEQEAEPMLFGIRGSLGQAKNRLVRIWEPAVLDNEARSAQYARLYPTRAKVFAKRFAAAHKQEQKWKDQRPDFEKQFRGENDSPSQKLVEDMWELFIADQVISNWNIPSPDEIPTPEDLIEEEAEEIKGPSLNFWQRKRLEFYLWSEKVLSESLAGIPSPWYSRKITALPTLAVVALGLWSIGRVPTPGDLYYDWRNPKIDVCGIQTPPYTNVGYFTAEEPAIITNQNNKVAADRTTAVHNGSYLDIEINTFALRDALTIRGGEKLLPTDIQIHFMLLPFTNSGSLGARGSDYAKVMELPASSQILQAQILRSYLPSYIPGRQFIEPIYMYDTLQRTLQKNKRIKSGVELRQAFTAQLGIEISDATVRAMQRLGLIDDNFPGLTEEDRMRLSLPGVIQVRSIVPNFLQQACEYGDASVAA